MQSFSFSWKGMLGLQGTRMCAHFIYAVTVAAQPPRHMMREKSAKREGACWTPSQVYGWSGDTISLERSVRWREGGWRRAYICTARYGDKDRQNWRGCEHYRHKINWLSVVRIRGGFDLRRVSEELPPFSFFSTVWSLTPNGDNIYV